MQGLLPKQNIDNRSMPHVYHGHYRWSGTPSAMAFRISELKYNVGSKSLRVIHSVQSKVVEDTDRFLTVLSFEPFF